MSVTIDYSNGFFETDISLNEKVGTISSTGEIDASTGNVFNFTPTNVSTSFSFTNVPTNYSAVLRLNGDTVVVSSYDITNTIEAGTAYDTTRTDNSYGIYIDSNGNYLFRLTTEGIIERYDFGLELDYSSLSLSQTLATRLTVDGASTSSGWFDLYFKDDGSTVYITEYSTAKIYEFSLTTPWDLTTLNRTPVANSGNMFTYSSESFLFGIYFKPDGTKIYLTGSQQNAIYEVPLGNAWDITDYGLKETFYTVTNTPGYFPNNPYKAQVSTNGSTMILFDSNTESLYKYTMSTPWDITTASWTGEVHSFVPVNVRMTFLMEGGTILFYMNKPNSFYYISSAEIGLISGPIFGWPSNIKWSKGLQDLELAPLLNDTNILTLSTNDGGTNWYGQLVGESMS